ncbi:MAG: hypothetical protein D5S00_09250 [Tindallia sp. MSAO_Bac2]|nr:MAG: hypothetical protein D5S00_09250 [Tindallia sp. MSAO_Bac2]
MAKRTISVFMVISLLMLLVTTISAFSSDEIRFQDEALERFIRREIGKPEGPIMPEDVEDLRTVDTTT